MSPDAQANLTVVNSSRRSISSISAGTFGA
jgi:hypothetical protein